MWFKRLVCRLTKHDEISIGVGAFGSGSPTMDLCLRCREILNKKEWEAKL